MPTRMPPDHAPQRDDEVEEGEVLRPRAAGARARRGRTCRRRRGPRRTRRSARAISNCRRLSARNHAITHTIHTRTPEVGVAPVPARALEAEDEGEEVDRERNHPQQRDRGDVLREVVRHREQRDRPHRGEREPQRGSSAPRDAARRLLGELPAPRARAAAGRGFATRATRPRPRRAHSRPTRPTTAAGSRATARRGTGSPASASIEAKLESAKRR